jgi:hypothetical protein
MLHQARQVAESDVDYLDAFVPRQLDDLRGGAILHVSSLVRRSGAAIGLWSEDSLARVRFGTVARM